MLPVAIKDLLYFDFEKAASIYSQFEGGLRERIAVTEDMGKDRSADTKFGIPKIAEAKLGVEYTEKTSILETKLLHHDLLTKVETHLSEFGLVADLGEAVSMSESSAEAIRGAIADRPYIKATGSSVIEDYRRILAISEKFNEIITFIAKCGMEAVKQSPEYVELQGQIQEARQAADSIKDRNQKAAAKSKLKALEKNVAQMVRSQLTPVDQFLLDGVQLWINTFMPGRINFRIYPFENCPSFQVLCNLKRECFIDQDLEHLLYGYGNRPNVSLSVFGIITSIPDKDKQTFDPMAEFQEIIEKDPRISFEESFRQAVTESIFVPRV